MIKLPDWITKVISAVQATPLVGGLEISDSALRFAIQKEGIWYTAMVRLVPGTMIGTEIKDAVAFEGALRALHAEINGSGNEDMVSVVVTLSSLSIYAQVFNLPFIEKEHLDQAIALNMQMVSPAEFKETYSGWQIVYHDKDRATIEVLSAFINKNVVDPMVALLEANGFLPVALESRALSLVRLIVRSLAGFDKEKSYIMLFVGTDGISFLVVRHGYLYFDYFNAWLDIQEPGTQISMQDFERVIVRNLHQVLNFYNAHWQEPVGELVVLTSDFGNEIATMVRNNFALEMRTTTIQVQDSLGTDWHALGTDWYAAIGSGFRGAMPRNEDRDVSLLGIDARREFEREQILSFARFWRIMTPAVLSIALIALLGADIYLLSVYRGLGTQPNVSIKPDQMVEIRTLEKKALDFNTSVALLSTALAASSPKTPLLKKLSALAMDGHIAVDRIWFQSATAPITITARAVTEDEVLAFKKTLETDGMFKDINLPVTNIQGDASGFSFSITFFLASP